MAINVEKTKLLVVEDEPDICTAVQSYFGRRGWVVSTTGSGIEALSMIEASAPDIVLLDISLIDLSGVDVLRQLRAYDKETRIIIVTGQMYSEEEIENISSLGISGYWHKPLVLHEVERLICETLRKDRPLQIPESVKTTEKGVAASGDVAHQLLNRLGIIRNKCENFRLGVEEGIYKSKSAEELVKMSTEVMKEIESAVDAARDIIEQLTHSQTTADPNLPRKVREEADEGSEEIPR